MIILFVDDETSVTQGLERALFHRDDWEILCAESGEEALEILGEEEVDVIVSDVRMPGMDGVELLRRVQAAYPHILRVVLSGHAKASDMLSVVPVAQRFLSKPCPVTAVEAVLDELTTLAELIMDAKLREFVHGVRELPLLPTLVRDLRTAMEDPNRSLRSLGEIVQRDPSLSAKLLQVVNAPFFGMSQAIQDVGDAICRLGSNTVLTLVTAMETFALTPNKLPTGVTLKSLQGLQKQSFLGAALARSLARDRQMGSDVFAAALLSNVGLLLLLDPANEAHHDAWGGSWPDVYEAERDASVVSHAKVAAYLLGLWGLPQSVVKGVLYHHEPDQTAEPSELVDIVHVATSLSRGEEPDIVHLEAHGRGALVQQAKDNLQ